MMHEAITAFTGKSSFLPIKGRGTRDKAEMPHAPFTKVVSGMHSFRPRHPASLPFSAFPLLCGSLLALESSIAKLFFDFGRNSAYGSHRDRSRDKGIPDFCRAE